LIVLYETKKRFRIRFKSLNPLSIKNGLERHLFFFSVFLTINWPIRHLLKEVNRWNEFDPNIKLNTQSGSSINFLDLYIENINGQIFTKVYHKPSYEPYYLPFNSVHPMHMKKNIPSVMLTRAIEYCSTFET
jgi:hypothetical protein